MNGIIDKPKSIQYFTGIFPMCPYKTGIKPPAPLLAVYNSYQAVLHLCFRTVTFNEKPSNHHLI